MMRDTIFRDSGVAWLGQLPSHWNVRKLKFQVEFTSVKVSDPPAGTRYVGLEHIESKTGKFMPVTDSMQTESESTVNAFKKGDVLFGKLRPYLGKAAVADTDGYCSSEILVLRPKSLVGDYLKRAMLLDGFIQTVDASTYGSKMPRADAAFISQLTLPEPPLDEQIAIAAYLDAETARIDVLIGEKHSLLPLLDEAKSSVIERATRPPTDGLYNPLSRFTERISTGPFGSALHSSDYISGGVAVINPTHIVDNHVVPDEEVTVSKDMAEKLGTYRLTANDIVVGRRGEMGRCAVISEDVNWLCGTGCLMITPEMEKVLPEFLQLVISSRASRDWLSLESVGTTMENLNSQILGRLPCFIPPIQDQLNRLHEAKREIEALDKLDDCVKAEIKLLKELRSSTITDAVLGRIDVSKAKNN